MGFESTGLWRYLPSPFSLFFKTLFYVIFVGLMINATQIRKGNVIIFNGIPHRVLSFEHRSPGKGAAFVRVLLRNLESGASYDNRFSSNDSVEKATLEQKEMEYLYRRRTRKYFKINWKT